MSKIRREILQPTRTSSVGFRMTMLVASSLLRGRVIVGYLRPVDHVPPCLDIFGAAVLIFEVVGVLPDVKTEEGFAAVHDGIVLIGAGLDGEFAVAEQEPGPAGAEALGGGVVKFRFEVGERAESGLDRAGEIAGGFATA